MIHECKYILGFRCCCFSFDHYFYCHILMVITKCMFYFIFTSYSLGIWKPYRFRQFYLDVSNTSATQTKTAHRTQCYTDNTAYPSVPPNIIDIPCKHKARYVIVETTYDAPEDDKYGVHGAILEVCEIEVYGKHFFSINCFLK